MFCCGHRSRCMAGDWVADRVGNPFGLSVGELFWLLFTGFIICAM